MLCPYNDKKSQKISVRKRPETSETTNMSSEESDQYSENTMWIVIGSIGSVLVSGVAYWCRRKMKNQDCTINSGCCTFHGSSETLRRTVREEIMRIEEEKELESQKPLDTD